MRSAPIAVGNSTMRPLASHEARPEPTAIPTENTARSTVTTSSVASSRFFTSGGRIDSVTAPTSQNQDTMTPPRHSRPSAQRSRSSAPVERRMLRSTRRSGAASPVLGMSRLAAQHSTAKPITSPPKEAGSPPSRAA